MNFRLPGAMLTAVCLASPIVLSAAGAPETARDTYTRALAQERQVRDDATHPTLQQMRRVVELYEALVRKHPASGYSDNALWQAGNLAALAYQRFGDEADRKTAMRLLTQLKTGYPSSRLAAQVTDALAHLPTPVPAVTPASAAASAAEAKPTTGTDADVRFTGTAAGVPGNRKSRSDSGEVTLIKDVKRAVLPDGVRLIVELDGEVAYHQEEIANPRRLFFDLKNVKSVPPLQDASLKFNDDVVREIRLGRHPQNTTRVVVDLEGVADYTVYPLYGPYRLVIDFHRTSAPATVATRGTSSSQARTPVQTAGTGPAAPVKALPAVFEPPTLGQPRSGAPTLPQATSARATVPSPPPLAATSTIDRGEGKEARSPAPLPSKPAAMPAAPPSANSNGKFSLSRQLGLGVSRVVIDAGHGGHDPGAHGNGINEAELTLDVALRLQKLLETAGIAVVMTRDTDVFIPLEERTAIANREGADLFLSIHANASRNPMAHGIETYYLNFATNPEAEAVAARENAASSQPMHSLPDIVKAIALNNKINESRELAETVQKSMIKKLAAKNQSARDLGVKQAPFVVLIGAAMPSVLAEISFVTNKQDGTQLKTNGYKQQIAQALADAVQNYQQSLKQMNGIAGKKATTNQ